MRSSGLVTAVIVALVFGGFAFLLYQNAQPTQAVRVVVPTQPAPTSNPDALAQIFSAGFGSNATPLPTIAIPTQRFVAPTLPSADETEASGALRPADLGNAITQTPISLGATPTPIPPTPTIPVGQNSVAQVSARATNEWQPPLMSVPQSRDPLGRDHYYFIRPVDSNATNYGLNYYPYGSNGSQTLGISRVHHGVDFSNTEGTPIRAAASGIVIFASENENDFYPGSASYGVVVIIEHDFSWNDQVVWTLYAHLSQARVRAGDVVEQGALIGLSGNSGRSSGPHLHFEVRIGDDAPLTYGDTQNPALWLVPYVGHGTLAGRLVDARGDLVEDVLVTARSMTNGGVYPTYSYTFDGTINQIGNDPNWQENFVIGDLPRGKYSVVVEHNGQRFSQQVDVVEGMTVFVEFEVAPTIATAQPVSPGDTP